VSAQAQALPPEVLAEIARARRRDRLRRNAAAYAFLLPNLLFFVAFLLWPVVWVFRQTFLRGGVLGPAESVGFENWRRAFDDPQLIDSLEHTLVYTAMYVPALIVLATLLALLLREIRRGSTAVRAAVYLPSLTSGVLSGIIWLFVVHPDFGLLNLGTRLTGAEPVNWLGDTSLAMPTVVLASIWRDLGFWALLLLAALIAVPKDLYDAARLDGASAWRRFWHVTAPSIRPTLFVAVVLALVVGMQVLDVIFVMTQGGPQGSTQSAVLYIYRSVFQSANPGYGAVLSVILLAIILVLTAVTAVLMRERRSA
jgi:ABC-type sugar transport system permease subunit